MSNKPTTNHFKAFIISVLSMLSIQSCSIKEDLSNCISEEFLLYVKVIDVVTGKDITETGTVEDVSLYIFDHNGIFFEDYSISAEQIKQKDPIIINNSGLNNMIISAWGNTKDQISKWEPDTRSTLESQIISLLENPDNNEYSQCPNDLFFGSHLIGQRKLTTHVEEVVITQKNARLHIVVRGLKDKNPEDIYFKIINQYNGYDFRGTPTQQVSRIKENGIFNENNEYISPQPYLLIHSATPESMLAENSLWIHLYQKNEDKDSEIVKTNTDAKGNPITLTSGKTTNVLIDIADNGQLHVYMQVTCWNEIYQWIEY